ncbi:hypothetical protein KL925_005310 [Ogataea polymorpha]|uniref:uncharacterized protein n=1 Tax=Ogataea polymorpha TaxID=460523 RepID=UPI0007F3C08B|nr:uncharacterized protein OGAPODRAFT_103439 [Ogataea polymorpha]KAG7885451.1 hypothetical protein KL936_005257 [Ogataea polymorpha]KAG7888595.1 hypothetical protein KL908_005142 [Ogataea polymorpha]KAG7897403.1 hypothetical protein KL935_005212 [Ogataea polymorpha]KAG7924507.1 hypothetical protein KL925_005310 [Ogataea polymorpha]KAG7929216.1 hypothetical protein KL934_005274 [Ogataea polymorpha]
MDDDLLLNFASEPPAKKQKVKVTGGRWKDRRKSQLASEGRGRNEKKEKLGVNQTKLGNRTKDLAAAEDEERPSKSAFPERRGEGGKNNTYVSSLFTANPEIQERPIAEIDVLSPSNAPLDTSSFSGLGLNDRINAHLLGQRIENPTKIQQQVIPRLLAGNNDLFVQAQTGSGKTLAFALPIFQKLMEIPNINRTSGLFALILAPTRELATQIHSVFESLSRCHHRIVAGNVIGGEKKKSEKARLRKGVNILVATPGRLVDHIEHTQKLDLSKIRYLVLDEGDRLMELGFEESITKILHSISSTAVPLQYPSLPAKRISILCSATIKSTVKKLGELSLEKAELVTTSEQITKVPDQLVQQVVVIPPKLRFVTLAGTLKNLIKDQTASRTIVFFSCSGSVDFHFIALTRKAASEDTSGSLFGSNIFKLHGSLSQQTRTLTLKQFAESPNNAILLCTDVASRGLDLPHINNVVEFDPPFALDDHLHRVGRTARAGSLGKSVLFLLPGDEENYLKMIEPLHPSGIHFQKYESVLKEAFEKPGEKGGSWDTQATTFHLDLERWLLEEPRAKEIAANGFISHIKAYATHLASERECFNVKKIHLGHLAKSFGLRETPKKLASGGERKKKEDGKSKMLRMAKMHLQAQTDEFNTFG